jgi:hypothetical protein
MNREPVRASPPSKAGPGAAPRVRSQRNLRLGRATVVIVVMLAVAAGLLPLAAPGTVFERNAGRLAAGVIFAARRQLAASPAWRSTVPVWLWSAPP